MDRNIQEEARRYAEQVLHRELDAVAKAYIDGYNSAKGIVDDGDMTYIDLGLPSGTLWATRFVGATEEHPEGCRMVYASALAYNIPTESQWNELMNLPHRIKEGKAIFYGTNGNHLTLQMTGFIHRDKLSIPILVFWLYNPQDGKEESKVAFARYVYNHGWSLQTSELFVGAFTSIIVVK